MENKIIIEDLTIPVILQRSDRKSLVISITKEGVILIKAPLDMKETAIERFLRQRRYWIYKQTKKVLDTKEKLPSYKEEDVPILKKKAREILTRKTDEFKVLLNVDDKKIRIGDQKTRWGSCSSSGTLSYNWHLILLPEELIDYVVVHELCHFIEMNHSKEFWKQVAYILPDYKERRKKLKELGPL